MIVALYKDAPVLGILHFSIQEGRSSRGVGDMPDNDPVVRSGDVGICEEGD